MRPHSVFSHTSLMFNFSTNLCSPDQSPPSPSTYLPHLPAVPILPTLPYLYLTLPYSALPYLTLSDYLALTIMAALPHPQLQAYQCPTYPPYHTYYAIWHLRSLFSGRPLGGSAAALPLFGGVRVAVPASALPPDL
ncbi:hypothetical protein BOTBODRAFT_359594 [Botryobasidium botryosum FD-172 SS1]|uniref:Uncharacterized protein n=1 Tax=Botryobasidium botryosum (strain FD-172 SS1) TaxID=930990 RepID=A0A067MQ81_BOTB1|nr:hypothetical protein BOTBODRAFT_359594 [Botryobasidium botryosum FD-172 SS1]